MAVARRGSQKLAAAVPRAAASQACFSAAANTEKVKLSSEKLEDLYGKIAKLKEDEVNILGALVLQMLGRKIFPGEFGRGLEGLELAAPAEEAAEEVVEQTAFAVKLLGKFIFAY